VEEVELWVRVDDDGVGVGRRRRSEREVGGRKPGEVGEDEGGRLRRGKGTLVVGRGGGEDFLPLRVVDEVDCDVERC